MVKVLLVDDHQLVREGIKLFLSPENWIEVVGEAKNGLEALDYNDSTEPDVILLDISMPELNGIEAAKQLLQADNQPKIIMLSMYLDQEYIAVCMKTGVHGYIHKGSSKEELLNGIRRVMEGKNFYSQDVKEIMLDSYIDSMKRDDYELEKELLTRREKQIVNLIVKGFTSKEIGENLEISKRTVETHRSNIMQKLEVKNSIELINKVKEDKLI